MLQIWCMKKKPLFQSDPLEVFVSQQTYNQILSLLVRDVYSKTSGKCKKRSSVIVESFYLPELKVTIVIPQLTSENKLISDETKI